jgi:hypothetical protein
LRHLNKVQLAILIEVLVVSNEQVILQVLVTLDARLLSLSFMEQLFLQELCLQLHLVDLCHEITHLLLLLMVGRVFVFMALLCYLSKLVRDCLRFP